MENIKELFQFNSTDMSIVVNVRECGFECTKAHFLLFMKWRETMCNFKYCVKK